MAANNIPGRVFLDTCVVNFMLDFGEQIHDGAAVPQVVPRKASDIEALRDLLLLGQRAMWQLAVSPHTYFEIAHTRDKARHSELDFLKHRSELTSLPIEIVTPSEWWTRIQPYAHLWT